MRKVPVEHVPNGSVVELDGFYGVVDTGNLIGVPDLSRRGLRVVDFWEKPGELVAFGTLVTPLRRAL